MWNPQRPKNALMMAAVVSTMLLAGCLGAEEETDPANEAPAALLKVDQETGWTTDEFTFDAQDSHDADGAIVRWVFDFGDGTTIEVDDVDDARVKHTYAHGGEYTVTLTVKDDGADQAGARTDTAQLRIAVNERQEFSQSALYGEPLPNETSTTAYPFTAHDGVDRVLVEGEVRSLLLAGSSEVKVMLIDEAGAMLADEVILVPASDAEPFTLDVTIEEAGDYELAIEVESGSVSLDGVLEILYDAEY